MANGAIAQQANFGLNLSGGSEAIKIDADHLEMRDSEGMAIFTGNVAVEQGTRLLRAGKMVVYYAKAPEGEATQTSSSGGLGSTGVDRMEVSGQVYVKSGLQVATGDQGVFDSKSNQMVLTGNKVVLVDGDTVATGCKLTANMATGKAYLESCQGRPRNSGGGVSIILNPNETP